MKYNQLKDILEKLESKYRDTKFHKDNYMRQYFVLDTNAKENDKDLPIVIVVGANYWQYGGEEYKEFCLNGVEEPKKDATNTRIKNFLNNHINNSFNTDPIGDFHLIFTNLSPYIAKEGWDEIDKKEKEILLAEAENLGHINELAKELADKKENLIWIGHTKSIFEQLEKKLTSICEIKEKFYLCNNLSRCNNPNFQEVKKND